MKKITSLTAFSILAGASFMTNAASSGEINFSGNITGTTCEVELDGGQGSTVTLPTVTSSELKSAGQTTGQTNFTLTLTQCVGDNAVAAFFQTGATVNNETGRLIQTATDGAKNVSLQLLDGTNGSEIFVGSQSQSQTNHFAQIEDGAEIKLPYSVRYYAEGAASSGVVTSSVIYNLQYK